MPVQRKSARPPLPAALAAALALAASAAPPRLLFASAEEVGVVTTIDDVASSCVVTLTDTRRPLYTEKEMKRFDESFVRCLEQISGEKPEMDTVEVTGQEWTDGGRRDRYRRELRGGNKVSVRVRCGKHCPVVVLNPDSGRHLNQTAQDIRDDFDKCMGKELSDGVDADDDDMEAFDFTSDSTVSVSCELASDDMATTTDVTDDGTFDFVDDIVCSTVLDGAEAPMLSEQEMLWYDGCMIQEYNKIFVYDPTAPLMVRNQIEKQDPECVEGVPTRGLRQGRRLLATSKNTVLSRTGQCRECDPEILSTRRRLLVEDDDAAAAAMSDASQRWAELAEHIDIDPAQGQRRGRRRLLLNGAFDAKFLECLQTPDADRGQTTTYQAFANVSLVCTECDEPLMTQSELLARQAESKQLFQDLEEKKRKEFEKKQEEEVKRLEEAKKRLEEAYVEHKQHEDEFDFQLKVEETTHKAITGAYFAEQMERIKNSCAIPQGRFGLCEGISVPKNLFTVSEAKITEVKFAFNQNFAFDTVTEKCRKDQPGYEDVHFLIEFALEEKDEIVDVECKKEKKKCGDDVEYQSKHCYWDIETERMVADVLVAIRSRDLGIGQDADSRLRLLGENGRGLDESESDCQMARNDALLLGEGAEHCVLEFKIDCNCEVTS